MLVCNDKLEGGRWDSFMIILIFLVKFVYWLNVLFFLWWIFWENELGDSWGRFIRFFSFEVKFFDLLILFFILLCWRLVGFEDDLKLRCMFVDGIKLYFWFLCIIFCWEEVEVLVCILLVLIMILLLEMSGWLVLNWVSCFFVLVVCFFFDDFFIW